MAAVPVTSDSAILGRFFDLSGEKPNATLAKAIKAHYRLAEEVVPQASAVRAAAEADMETARRAGLAGDIEYVYKAISKGGTFEDLALTENPLIAAQANLDNASRMEVAAKKATRAAADFVGVCAREPAARMILKMQKAMGSESQRRARPGKDNHQRSRFGRGPFRASRQKYVPGGRHCRGST